MKLRTCLFSAAIAGLLASTAHASIMYTVAGSTHSENFDSLPNTPPNASVQASRPWVDDTTQTASNTSIPGWYLWHPTAVTPEGGTNMHQRIRYGNGSSNTGAFYSFGANATTDRALGMVSSGTLATAVPLPTPSPDNGESYFGARFTNGTGAVLTQFTLSFTGEQWRDGGATTPNAQSIVFGYKLAAASIQDTGYTGVPALDFTSPVLANTASGAAVDGNVAGKGALQSSTITGLNWLPNTDLWIRWTDINNSGNDHGLSVDDLTFVATGIPEPGSLVLAGFGLLASLVVSRRRA